MKHKWIWILVALLVLGGGGLGAGSGSNSSSPLGGLSGLFAGSTGMLLIIGLIWWFSRKHSS